MADPIIKRTGTRTAVGLEVASLGVTMMLGSDSNISNQPAAAFALAGGFDGCRLTVDRVFATSYQANAPTGNLNVFTGRVSDVEVTGTAIQLEARSEVELLNVKLPRNLYMGSCMHTLYDSGCGLSAAAFETSGVVGANSTRYLLVSNLAQADGYFNLGVVVFNTGAMANLSRTVRSYANGDVVPAFPFPVAPAPGDTFVVRPGCDKLYATCNGPVFNNANNYRGFEFIPVPEASY
jgi:uncharacterized phage protein (TIGR02218 family)